MVNFISNLGACYIKKRKRCLSTKMLGLTLRYVSVFDVIIIRTYKKKYNTRMHYFKIEIQRR